MSQKFKVGEEVYITKDLPSSMSHFPKGMNAIVLGTYSLCHGGTDGFKDYKLLLLDKDGLPYTTISWYKEDQLTLISRDIEKGYGLFDQYVMNKL